MRPEDIPRHDRRVPRYTSYPTAADFTPAVDAATYRDWLAAIPPGEDVSLYLHIPFCPSLCWFCGCHTSVARRPEPVDAYLGLIKREIDMLAEVLGPHHRVAADARLLLRVVCAAFDRRLPRAAARHSVAV